MKVIVKRLSESDALDTFYSQPAVTAQTSLIKLLVRSYYCTAMRRILSTMMCLLLLPLCAHALGDPLADLLRRVDAELQQLQRETDDAAARGRAVYLERASLELGRYYRNVSQADASNASMAQLFEHFRAFYADAPPGFADARARSLPLREANDTLALLGRARAALAAGPARPPLPSRDMRGASVCDGYLCNGAGKPVIPVGFNVWSFPAADHGPFDEAAAGISLVTTGFGVDRVLENLTLDSAFVAELRVKLDAAAAKNISVHTLGFGSAPAWAEQRWPGIRSGNFTQHGVSFDISSPGVPVLLRAAITGAFDAGIGCHPALGGFILGNEVAFMQSSTPAMLASYHGWLASRYPGGVAALNSAWGTTYASFEDVPGQPPSPGAPVTTAGPQAAQWWDWNAFNNWRVTQMYSNASRWIREAASADPRCDGRALPMTTLKLQDRNEFNGLRSKGIDRAALVGALAWNGCDSGMASNSALDSHGRVNPKDRVMNPPHNLVNPPGGKYPGESWPVLYNKSRYAADWLGQGAGYTLQHSLDPAKPVYDTEWHSIGTLTWRDESMPASYVELAVWFTLYHYLALNVAWYFPREGLAPQPARKFNGSLVGSFATLPAAISESVASIRRDG